MRNNTIDVESSAAGDSDSGRSLGASVSGDGVDALELDGDRGSATIFDAIRLWILGIVYYNFCVFERQRRAVPFDVVIARRCSFSCNFAVIVRLGVGYPIICAVQPYAADSDVCELADVCLGGAVEVMIIPVIFVSFAAVNTLSILS